MDWLVVNSLSHWTPALSESCYLTSSSQLDRYGCSSTSEAGAGAASRWESSSDTWKVWPGHPSRTCGPSAPSVPLLLYSWWSWQWGDGRCVSVGAIDAGQRKRKNGSDSSHSNWPSATQNQPHGGNVISDELLYNLCAFLPYSPDYNLLNKHPSGNPNLHLTL